MADPKLRTALGKADITSSIVLGNMYDDVGEAVTELGALGVDNDTAASIFLQCSDACDLEIAKIEKHGIPLGLEHSSAKTTAQTPLAAVSRAVSVAQIESAEK